MTSVPPVPHGSASGVEERRQRAAGALQQSTDGSREVKVRRQIGAGGRISACGNGKLPAEQHDRTAAVRQVEVLRLEKHLFSGIEEILAGRQARVDDPEPALVPFMR